MPKKKNKLTPNKLSIIAIIISAISLIALIAVSIIGYKLAVINSSNDFSQSVADTLTSLQHSAPRDARTGYTYFPERRLYLPIANPDSYFTYNLTDLSAVGGQTNNSFWVGTEDQVRYTVNDIRNQTGGIDSEEYANNTSKAQVCIMGVLVSFEKVNKEQVQLTYTVNAGNGKTVYIYTQNACPDTKPIAKELRAIKAY